MVSLSALVFLIVYIYTRPQEVFLPLAAIPLPVFLVLTAILVGIDLARGVLRAHFSPVTKSALLFFGWAFMSLILTRAGTNEYVTMATPLILFLAVALVAQTFPRIRVITTAVLVLVGVLSTVAVHQGRSPFQCVALGEDDTLRPDGRECVTQRDCGGEDAEPDTDYLCERVGVLGTTSIGGGRVRYRGVLQDPNELAWATSAGLPFAFLLFDRRRTLLRLFVLIATLVLVLAAVMLTQSRGGQLSFLAVMAVYFVRRFGLKGAIPGAVLALPVMLFGGRSGGEADSSTMERAGCWSAGIAMWREHPIFGVGAKRFLDHHGQTAHNSLILALAEMGPIALLAWTATIYMGAKIAVQATRALHGRAGMKEADATAVALLACVAGTAVSSFFLSIAYHVILWITLGLCAGFATALTRQAPEARMRFTWRDMVAVAMLDIFLMVGVYGYLRHKGV